MNYLIGPNYGLAGIVKRTAMRWGSLLRRSPLATSLPELGVPNGEPLDNHAAYLKSWLQDMKNDPNYIFRSVRRSLKSERLPLLSFVRQVETEPVKGTIELVEDRVGISPSI